MFYRDYWNRRDTVLIISRVNILFLKNTVYAFITVYNRTQRQYTTFYVTIEREYSTLSSVYVATAFIEITERNKTIEVSVNCKCL